MVKLRDKNKTEAYGDVAVVRVVVDTIRDATAPRVVDPAATAKHTARTIIWAFRIGLGITCIIVIPVLAPLPHVATHIVDAKFVGLLGLHWVGAIIGI